MQIKNKTFLICIPTYNEIDNLEKIINLIKSQNEQFDILIADDASPDGTGVLADKLSQKIKGLYVLHRKKKEGLAKAYLDCFSWGYNKGYEYIAQMDADLSHPASALNKMAAIASSSTIALGSRWVKGGKTENWPWHRIFISRAGSFYAGFMLRIKVKDITSGFKIIPRAAIELILKENKNNNIKVQGYAFQINLLRIFIQNGFKICEIPITFKERQYGKSKMSMHIVLEAMWQVTKWGISDIFKKRK